MPIPQKPSTIPEHPSSSPPGARCPPPCAAPAALTRCLHPPAGTGSGAGAGARRLPRRPPRSFFGHGWARLGPGRCPTRGSAAGGSMRVAAAPQCSAERRSHKTRRWIFPGRQSGEAAAAQNGSGAALPPPPGAPRPPLTKLPPRRGSARPGGGGGGAGGSRGATRGDRGGGGCRPRGIPQIVDIPPGAWASPRGCEHPPQTLGTPPRP